MQKINFFEILGVQINFDLHYDLIHKNYLKKQIAFKDQQNKIAKINEAYSILNDPLQRANHILEIYNISIDKVIKNKQMLEEVMLVNDKIDTTKDIANLNILLSQYKKRYNDLVNKMKNDFSNSNMKSFAQHAIQLSYINKIVKNIKQKIYTS